MREVSSRDDSVDTWMIIERIDELSDEYMDISGEILPPSAWEAADAAELQSLRDVIEAIGEDAAADGVTLVSEGYFAEHVKDYYKECCLYMYREDVTPGPGSGWRDSVRLTADELLSRSPFRHIDWNAVAEDDRSDYSVLTWDGVTFYYLEP